MALTPFLFNELDDWVNRGFRTGSLFDQNFGLGLVPDDLLHPELASPLLAGYLRPWRNVSSQNSGISNIHCGDDGFKVNLDVQQFKPDEINVKMVDDCVVIEGKHEERKDDHGYVSRHFQRRYKIPENFDKEALVSKLSSDGVLSIEAPKKASADDAKERVIQITHTNTPAVSAKPQEEKKAPKKKRGGEKMEQ